jgi:hypothetical protein
MKRRAIYLLAAAIVAVLLSRFPSVALRRYTD